MNPVKKVNLIILGCFLQACFCSDHIDEFCYYGVRVDTPIIIDGRLNEISWEKTHEIILKENLTGMNMIDSSFITKVRSCYDKQNVYIAFTCYDKDIWATLKNRDDYLWKEEVVEVFIDTDDDSNTYIEIEVSPLNVLFDSYIVNPREIDFKKTAMFDLKNIQNYQSVSRIDQGLGMLVEMLKEEGVYDNTIIIFSSDNGHSLPMCKVSLYDPGVHLPLIVRTPNQSKRNIVNNAMVSFVDIAPTILDYAGISMDSLKFHGRSFKNILEQESPQGWDEVYGSETFHQITWYYPRRMVRTKQYKLIRNFASHLDDPAARQYHSTWQRVLKTDNDIYGKRNMNDCIRHPEYELYDLDKDPFEIVNLSNSEKYVPVFNELKQKLDSFQRVTHDPWTAK